jgi:hypothetical protein
MLGFVNVVVATGEVPREEIGEWACQGVGYDDAEE